MASNQTANEHSISVPQLTQEAKHHNGGFFIMIGSLVVNWANNESLFLRMLQALVGGAPIAGNVLWFSQHTTKARLDVISRLSRAVLSDVPLRGQIESALKQFRSLSKVRNFYCHAYYDSDSDGRLTEAHLVGTSDQGEPLNLDKRSMDLAAANQLTDTIKKLAALNRGLRELAPQVESWMTKRHVRHARTRR